MKMLQGRLVRNVTVDVAETPVMFATVCFGMAAKEQKSAPSPQGTRGVMP